VAGVTRILLAVALLVAGCTDGQNTQYLSIGAPCASDGNCGTRPYNCAMRGYPGGYCQKDCTTPGDCPSDAWCVAGQCRRLCTLGCRVAEGYRCVDEGAGMTVCDVPSAAVSDGGPPSG
jgi:hypothetical protein